MEMRFTVTLRWEQKYAISTIIIIIIYFKTAIIMYT
jgi:hypothetical protein